MDVTSTAKRWMSGGTLNEGVAVTPVIWACTATASVVLTSKGGTALGLPAELDIEFKPALESAVLELPVLFTLSGGVALLNHRQMASMPPAWEPQFVDLTAY